MTRDHTDEDRLPEGIAPGFSEDLSTGTIEVLRAPTRACFETSQGFETVRKM
jgi:hypothetical protein